MIPDRVGSYLIERKIGSGGMGTVYQGKHEETGQIAAVKVMPASLAREEGFVMRFTREVEAMKSLTNKHVVEVYENGVDHDGTYYYAMEYVDGVTLSNYIRKNKKMPWRQVIELSIQICQALKSAHDAGIIHRDLKPSNLIITPENEIKLLDFGVAQVFASTKLTKTGGIIGTAEYMSPEQAKGQRATKKSDIYSLGAVMYAMLTARPPFSGQTSMEVIQKHRFGQFDRPRMYAPDIPYWLDEVVCKCLEKDPDDRYPDTYVLSLRLKEIIKKVDLAAEAEEEGQTSATATASADGLSETVVADTEDPNAVGGTLMRDLLRAEIDQDHEGSVITRYLDNTWVLLGLLIAVVAGGFFWFRTPNLTEEERYEQGLELYQQGKASWPRAREEYLQPLLESDPERWSEKVEPILSNIMVEELKQDFGLTRLSRKRFQEMPDAHRFLMMASEYYRLGDRARAEQILENLHTMLAGNEDREELRLAIGEILDELRAVNKEGNEASDSAPPLAEETLKQARTLMEEGKEDEARSILRSFLLLYDGDSLAEAEVQQARQLLEEIDSR